MTMQPRKKVAAPATNKAFGRVQSKSNWPDRCSRLDINSCNYVGEKLLNPGLAAKEKKEVLRTPRRYELLPGKTPSNCN